MKKALMLLGLGGSLALPSYGATIVGTILEATGTGYATNVLFVPLSTPYVLQGTNLVASKQTNVTLGASGALSVPLVTGNYRVTIGNNIKDSVIIVVPNSTNTYQLAALITNRVTFTFTASPIYEYILNKNAANGYAGLGSDGKLPASLLGSTANFSTFIGTNVIVYNTLALADTNFGSWSNVFYQAGATTYFQSPNGWWLSYNQFVDRLTLSLNTYLFNGTYPISAMQPLAGDKIVTTNTATGTYVAVKPESFWDDEMNWRTAVWMWGQSAMVNIGGSSPTAANAGLISFADANTGHGVMMTNDATGTFHSASYLDGTAGSWGYGGTIMFKIIFTHYDTNQGMIFNFGFTTASSASTMGTNLPVTTPFIMGRASSTGPDTTYKLVTSDGLNNYSTGDSGFTIDNTPRKEIWLQWNPAISNVVMFTNGIAAVTNSANLPATNLLMRAFLIAKTLNSAPKSNKVEVVVMKQKRKP
jgi:hypothetical protein